jgi:8-oxo-dGTP diphosphatase
MSLPLAWEFPGGKVGVGEDPRSALAREIAEELSLEIAVGDYLGRGVVGIVTLDIYVASVIAGSLELTEHAASRWVAAKDLDSLNWAAADLPVLPNLRRLLECSE